MSEHDYQYDYQRQRDSLPARHSSAGAYFKLSGTVAITAIAVVLALTYGSLILWILASLAGLVALRYLLFPAIKIFFEAFDIGAETYIKISTHRASLRELRQFTRLEADENGNYPGIIDSYSGQVISYLKPGNSQVAPSSVQFYDSTAEEEDAEPGEMPLLEAGIDPATVKALSMQQELDAGMLRAGQPASYGWKVVNDPFTGRYSLEAITGLHEFTTFLVGWSGAGKSALVAACMARRVVETYGRVAFLIVDPHKANPERSLSAKIRPALDPWLFQPRGGSLVAGNNAKDLRAIVDFLKAEMVLRLERDDLTEEQKRRLSPVAMLPIWLVVDEALALARQTRIPGHDKVYEEFVAILQAIATETAKGKITGIYMAQLGAKAQLGAMEIRDVCPFQVILRTPKDQAETLGLTAADARIAKDFPKGRGFISDGGEPEIFVWGYASPEDITRAVEGLSGPFVQARKQDGNKIINLRSGAETGPLDGDMETGWNDDGNEFPEALQAELDQIPGWPDKLEILESLIGADRGDVFKALFGRAPGGRNNAELAAQYEVLAEAVRYRYQQAREGRRLDA